MMCSKNITQALEALGQERSSAISSICCELAVLLTSESFSYEKVVEQLADYIIFAENVPLFRKHLSSILLALVSTKIPLKPVFSDVDFEKVDFEKKNHIEFSITLSLLSEHPDILQYALKYFAINSVLPFEAYISLERGYNHTPKRRRHSSRPSITEHAIVQCCHTLLSKLPNELSSKWDWANFIAHFWEHENAEIRLMIKECMVILTNMTNSQSRQLSSILNITHKESLKPKLHTNKCIIPSSIEKTNIFQGPEVANEKNKKDIASFDTFEIVGDKGQFKLVNKEKFGVLRDTTGVVNIDGILLPIYSKSNVQKGSLVRVKSTLNNLRSLALAVASGKALCLMGPVGSGKTSLVEYLASITGRKGVAFKKVQLGDQTDSRMLLGSHQCTDVPGEFVWRPGVLTEAVQNGDWLLLEDIDCAALDVASTLSSLLERNALCVPGYRDSLPVTPGFQLFVTQRTLATNYGFQKKMTNSSALLQKHLTQINVEPLSRTELGEVIQTLYPALTSICSRMIEVFMMFSVGSHDTSLQTTEFVETDSNVQILRGSRLTSTRDLIKWCARAVQGFDVSSPSSAVKVLKDALDIFTRSVASPDHRLQLAKKVGTCLGIVETEAEYYCKHYKPVVGLEPTALEVGRAKIPRQEKSLQNIDFDNKQVVFSFTRQSACLLESIACCVAANEPVLLVGETGTGKTSSIQYLAKHTGNKLIVINMNQQSDSADLLGGYKPVDFKYVIRPLTLEFEELFRSLYNIEKNEKFLSHINTCFESESWTALVTLMKHAHKAAISKLENETKLEINSKTVKTSSSKDVVDKLVHEKKVTMLKSWLFFGRKLVKLEQQVKAASRLSFAFIEGSLVKAMQEGNWVLLDEINLASPEILECIAGLLEDKNETIDLLEKGDKVPIKRHENFTLFACMNPATDVGKKDLPVGLRNRFTEFYVDELIDKNDLVRLIGDYLYHMNLGGAMLEAIYSFYSTIRKEAKLSLVDGAGNAPHYSLRTLCRALTAAAKANCGTVARSLFEAFCLSFLTQLDSSSHPKVEAMVAKAVLGKKNIKSVMNQLIPEPQVRGQNYLLFEGHWIPQGKLEIVIPEGYILTPTVRKNLRDIARIISLGRLPVLLQGDTSVGKTSLITYIAKASGNYCVRINNHEHTDLQEYIGSYAADASGKLVFKEGVLVEAMRKGYWIILDELNLAPSDVLEALNRVLDDNRELFIPETQQVVKADTNFMLFATQNPPGLYGGRKMLSRAFRNRFVELHFDEIPRDELETILHKRCHVPPTYSKKMIAVMAELQIRRRGSAAVQGKDGFITLRDLFRWGQRYKHASKEMLTEDKFYDWDQHLADEGYLVLAGKVRQTDERKIIEEVIEKHINRKVYPENLFNLHQTTSPVTKPILEMILNNQLKKFSHVVWTYNMRRLAVLIAKAFSFNEPVLLVGETGCGKTTICQVLATLKRRQLLSVNCHMHTESSDFLGGLRPVRQHKNDGRLFEWMDGPLIKAMESGDMFLADEISLADDSVLERLNSLLEPERQLVLAERGIEENSDIVVITAVKNFHFIGTMNPGGDFGKKELSPALRNRFTEIWCDSVTSREDLQNVLEKSVSRGISLGNQEDGSSGVGSSILDFTEWLKNIEVTSKFPFSIRDLLSWVQFINTTVNKGLLETPEAYVHGACMTFLDCFGTALTGHIDSETLFTVRKTAIDFLLNQIKTIGNEYTDSLREMLSEKQTKFHAESDSSKFGIRPFYIDMGADQNICEEETQQFTFTAPTTGSNTLRLLRGLQLNKAILLEGNPGVGKTSLVTALAKSSGHKVVRINLSDQTDITDLFGTDLPTEDGSFTFKEGAFLSALQNGDWILLDELNLAPQPVLEGLNACLDHRGEVFIPELGKSFKVKPQTRLFACQNPLKQGGARRGLPVSFLNRFIQVYVDTLTKEDLLYIVESQYSSLPKDILHRIVDFNCKVAREVTETQAWGHRGAPWEMNLRDIQRWCEALIKDQKEGLDIRPGKFVDMLYINRMRTFEDKEKMTSTYDKIFHPQYPRSDPTPQFDIDDKRLVIGDVTLNRNIEKTSMNRHAMETNLLVLRNQISTLKSLAQSVKMNWLTILVGQTATGKSSAVQVLADLTGNDLQCIPVTSAMDVSDLLGGFEQVDYNRNLEIMYDKIEILTTETVRNLWLGNNLQSNNLLSQLHEYKNSQAVSSENEIEKFKEKIQFLLQHSDKLIKYNKTYSASLTKLQQIVSSLNSLNTKLCNMSTVNAGGKFEWVDSVLVKTMSEGSWLLLDNVNLTSAAVLDRLNGLLEPNGVLSIPERGEFSEITPHPNFRVFFTMDPKYGEISRAMRNRGVEICLLKPDECNTNFSETMSSMDLTALLSSCGLPKSYHALCIECHEAMASFIQGFDQPTLSHLLQAAHMTWQQIVRGLPHNTALKNSFSDVYIKPRCGGDFASDVRASLAEMKNSMLKTLEKILEKITFDIQIDSNTLHTLTVKGLCSDSLLEKTIHIAYPAIQELTDKFGNALNKCYSYFVTYKRCPKECLGILHDVLKEMTETNQAKETGNLAIELNKMCEFLEENNPEACKRFSPESNTMDTKTIKEVNRKTVILFIEISKLFTLKSINKHANSLSALDYSRTVASGALADEFNEYPILKNCEGYLQLIDKQIQSAVNSAEDSLDDENTCRILQLLNWRHRFVVVCSEPLFYKNKKTFRVEEVVPLLDIHCKWVEKNLINELHKLSPHNVKEIGAFNKIVEQMKSQNEIDNSEMAKMGKKLRKLYGQPKLYKDQKEYDLCVARNSIYDELTLDMGQPIEKQLNKLTTHLCCTNSSLALDVPVRNQLEEIQGYLAQSHVMKNNSDIKLLPINAYVVQRVFTILMREVPKILSRQSSLSEELLAVIANLVHLGTVSQVFSPALLNTLQLVKQPIESEEMRISSLPSTFWTEVYKSMVNSPALYPLPFFNLVDLDSEDDVMLEIPTHTKRVSTNLPLMPYYVQQLTVSHNEGSRHILAYETISLESRAKYSEQLGAILNILWKNIATVDTSASLKLLSDAKFEMNKYEVLISYIHSILTPETFDQNPLKNPIQILKEYFKDDSYLIDIMVESNKAYKALSTAVQTPNTIDKFRVKILTMEVSLLTSLMFLKVMSEMNSVDHVERYRLKVKYIHEDIQMFETLLSAYYMQGLVSGTVQETKIIERASDVTIELLEKSKDDLKRVHPYCSILMEMKERTAEKIEKYATGNTFRPTEPSYSSFVKDCKHLTKSVLSAKTTKDLSINLISTCNVLYLLLQDHRQDKQIINKARTVLKETASWLYSASAFSKKIDNYSNAFPDLAKPLQSSISQIVYSVTSLNDLIRESIVKIEQGQLLREVVENMMVYPSNIPPKFGKEKFLNRFVTSEVMQLVRKNVIASNDDSMAAELESLELLKMNLLELQMHSIAKECTDDVIMASVVATLGAIVKTWEKQQRDVEKKKQDDEALYVTKSKCEDEDEEGMAYEERLEMFPTYTETDFGEFKPPTLEQKPQKPTQSNTNKLRQLISSEDVTLVYKWHSSYLKNLTLTEWLPGPKKMISNDVITPFLERYPIFSRIIESGWEALDADIEGVLSPSLMVIISQIKEKVDGTEPSSSKLDFYRSPWVSETRQCVPLLYKVKDATNTLLDQWPDFPTLKDIITIVNRILGFPVTSPISRFLTGLELLRDKIEEWNKNAHKGNNMIDISLEVGQQIINWRKLEMGHWKECLNNLYNRKQSEAHKYWFYMYSVVTSYLDTNIEDPVSSDRVISVLKDFMETSNLAEYEVRLDIVYVYHCHLVHLKASSRRDELVSILWNTYNYYSQFSNQVASYIKEKRAPIEKKLRDFVKICTWDRDLSYWSVKDTVEKAHKALHKHTKEFENILKESVARCLIDNTTETGVEHVGIWDRPKRATGAGSPTGGAYMVDSQNYLVLARNVKHYLDQSEKPSAIIAEGSLLSKIPSLLNKAKALCKDTMTNTSYPSLVQGLDDFVTMVIETSTHLGSLEIDATSPKDKQKSQAKNIVQQKRKALADLFKYLSKMGLNYRTGLVILSANESLYDFTIPPVNLDAAISYLKSRRCDASLAMLWSGCEQYFQKNIVRHRLLAAGLVTPHQDLGMQNIERCKGFAAQLLKLTNGQKKSIAKYSRHLYDLRTLVTNLTNALDLGLESDVSGIGNQISILTECFANTEVLLDQFSVVLKSCPENSLGVDNLPNFDAILSNSPIVRCYKNSDEWKDLYGTVKKMISITTKQNTALHKLTNATPKCIGRDIKNDFISDAHVNVSINAISELRNIAEAADSLLEKYQIKYISLIDAGHKAKHPILNSIVHLSTYLRETLNELGNTESNTDDVSMTDDTSSILQQTEDLTATILLIIQSVYKKNLPLDKTIDNSDVISAIDEIISETKEKEESKEILEDNHLKELLQERLSSDSRMLQLQTLVARLEKLLINYVQYIAENRQDRRPEVINAVQRLVPILEQMILFVQYFVTQKVAVHRVSCKMLSVLLKIFTDLATKGFCKPSDLDMEEGEGDGGPGKLSSGTGLGDGEGQKDVSDRIENQDQLDDAKQPGEEKNEEDRDCKEEEKGVNMTDDFDSHLQDVDKKDGENSDKDDDDDDDPDKQMGDIDNAADKLDQQIWGSEDEEDPEEQSKNEKEDKGKGESTGEKEMAAKEQEQGTDDGEEGKEKKKKKDINEMEEPEVDDDHVDPYHGNQQPMPEPEDFEMPDNMDLDGEEPDEKEGETETENPFEIDVMKENLQEEKEDTGEEEKENRNGLDVSSDEEDDGKDDKQDNEGDKETEDSAEYDKDKTQDDEKNEGDEGDDNTDDVTDQAEKEPETADATEEAKEEEENENLPANNEKMTDEDEQEQKNQETNPQANPSSDDPSAGEKAENAQMDKGTDDNVDTNAEQVKDEESAPFEQVQEQVGDEKQSTGRSELDKSDKGHRGERQATSTASAKQEKRTRHENKPGKTDQERTLGDVKEKKQKQSHTLNVEKEDTAEEGGDQDQNSEQQADAYQHVKQAKKDDLQAIDAATKEQAEQQPTLQQDDENGEELKEDEQVAMDVDEDDLQVEKSEELKPEKLKEGTEKQEDKSGSKKEGGDEPTGETAIEVEGDAVATYNVMRGNETTYHTRLDQLDHQSADLSVHQYMSIREWLHTTPQRSGGGAGVAVWRGLWQECGGAARALCERLRLVLEPTGRSRRAGDFRTGRAINMRRVIPYIASHFRKDRIWLRRTKPAKREYKIAIAVDDSSSMSDNRSKELAFESLALVSQALNLLESGEIAVLSFGEQPNLLHPFTEQFSEHSGSKILEQLTFQQTKTKIAQLLDFCTVMFEEQSVRSDTINAKLLLVVSDGRGIFSEGETKVTQAVRRARQQGIFLVYVIIDNPDNKDSIMDIRKPLLDPTSNKLVGFVQYLDTFPFPFYLILRDMSALPTVLGDALRQWFELAANTN